MKNCRDCKFCSRNALLPNPRYDRCTNEKAKPVYLEKWLMYTDVMRLGNVDSLCGENAQYFEPDDRPWWKFWKRFHV